MRRLLTLIFLSVTCISQAQSLQGKALYEQYREQLGLNFLKDQLGVANADLVLRLIEDDDNKISSYTVRIRSESGKMTGDIAVLAKFSGKETANTLNRRELSPAEIFAIVDIVNRRELMFLPTEFSPGFGDIASSYRQVCVELISKEMPKGNVLTRSFSQSDSVEGLRDLLVAIAYAPKKDWKIEPVPPRSSLK